MLASGPVANNIDLLAKCMAWPSFITDGNSITGINGAHGDHIKFDQGVSLNQSIGKIGYQIRERMHVTLERMTKEAVA